MFLALDILSMTFEDRLSMLVINYSKTRYNSYFIYKADFKAGLKGLIYNTHHTEAMSR